jgi:hypothetical protein
MPVDWLALIEKSSQPLTKLMGTVADAVGTAYRDAYEPWGIRRRARAEGDAEIIRAERHQKALEIEERAARRRFSRELRQQQNIEAITKKAADEMPDLVSDQAVDQDWVFSFFSHCEDVSNEQMQTVWARILRGEVTQPRSFSLRTLAAVKLFAFNDADLFSKLCSYVWQTPDGPVPMITNGPPPDEPDGITDLGLADLLNLRALGLINYETVTMLGWTTDNPKVEVRYFGHRYSVSAPPEERLIMLDTAVFLTGVGAELAPIAGAQPNEEFREATVAYWRGKGLAVTELQP